jgi:hypothetical protein
MRHAWATAAVLASIGACGRTGADPSLYGPPLEQGGATGAGASSASSSGEGGVDPGPTTAVSSSSSGTGGEGATGACAAENDCQECFLEECTDVWCTCQAEEACLGLLGCLGGCGGQPGCFGQCAQQHPDGIALMMLVSDCAATVCDSSCPFGNELNPCQKCRYEKCAPEMNACLSNPNCLGLVQCFQACGQNDPRCVDSCTVTWEAGLMGLQGVTSCTQDNCADVCP